MENKEIIWRAAEYEYKEKALGWYWLVVIFTIILAMFALWQKNFFFLIFIIFAGIVLLFLSRKRPRIIEFKVTEKGIGVGETAFFFFEDIDGVHLRERPGHLDEIILKRKTILNPYVKIPIDRNLREIVNRFLENKEVSKIDYEDSLIDILAEWLGF